MKRISVIVLLLIMLISLCISLVGCTETATDFTDNTIENGYYNYLSGGNMASVDNSLYINVVTDSLYMGTYKVDNDGTDLLFEEKIPVDYSVNAPCMYQLGDDVYLTDPDYTSFYLLDSEKDLLTDEKLNINMGLGLCYFSDDLTVCIDDHEKPLLVKYKENDEIRLEETVSSFTVYEDKIYFICDDGYLYVNDPSKLTSECELVSELNGNGSLTKMLVCDEYCYFTDSGSLVSDGKAGLYKYSFEKDSVEMVLQLEVLSLNVQDEKVYIATDKGVYVDDSSECTRFSKIKTDEIYVFDDEWIYLYNGENGKAFRVSNDGAKTQKID